MATATEVKAPQTAAFTDGAVDVAPGDTIFLETDETTSLYPGEFVTFYYDSAGIDLVAFVLSGTNRIQAISGYAKLIGKKGVTVAKVGIGKFSA